MRDVKETEIATSGSEINAEAGLERTWTISEPYQPRPIAYHGVRAADGWRLKVYSIVYGGMPVSWPVYETGLELALAALPRPAVAEGRPGVGFVIVHQGRGVHYLVLNWWGNENELFNRVFIRGFGVEDAWRAATAGEAACVWDLQVIWAEREAYVATVLSGPGGPDLDAYLARHIQVPA